MPVPEVPPTPRRVAPWVSRGPKNGSPQRVLSPEVQSRDVMAQLVHDVVADAFRLGLHDGPKDVVEANGVRVGRKQGG